MIHSRVKTVHGLETLTAMECQSFRIGEDIYLETLSKYRLNVSIKTILII